MKVGVPDPEHTDAGLEGSLVMAGAVVGVTVPVVDALLVPHTLEAVTDTVPSAVPTVIVAELVLCPAVIAHPVPDTLQV